MRGKDKTMNRILPRGSAASVRLVALIAAILLASGAGLARAGQGTPQDTAGRVYTADEHGNSISAIDLPSGDVETVPVAISPHNVQMAAGGARLLAVGDPASSGHGHGADDHGDEAEGQLLVLDPEHLAAGPVAAIAVGDHPAHVVADREGRYAYVTLAGANAVAVVDLGENAVGATITTGRYPHGLRLAPAGRELYVANVEDGSVSVIDTRARAEVARIPVGRAPVQVGFTPDGGRVYVSLRDENQIAVIDTATRAVVARIPVGRGPIQVHATPDGRFVYVANQGSEAEPADTVSVIDVASGAVIDTVRTGAGAHGVAVSDDGRYVFVTNIVDGTVSVIETERRSVVTAFPVGRGPNGITFRPVQPQNAASL
jgi:YVTN family beta-propeller protein